jgi:hypothetical protein
MSKAGKVILMVCVILIHLALPLHAQNKVALLIGIGDYSDASGWKKIHGNNDMPLISQMLKSNGFLDDNIYILTDGLATKQHIVQSFERLVVNAKEGDIVYIHFSGHGQQITDVDGDEADGFDEAWIPYDAYQSFQPGVYEGENHFLDDELNSYLYRIRNKVGVNGKIIVISDACHSGDGSRGDGSISESDDGNDYIVRGTVDKFVIPTTSNTTTHHRRSIDWLYVAACKSFQCNFEYRGKDGRFYGSLSYVIANDSTLFYTEKYLNLVNKWDHQIGEIVPYPQNIDSEGCPSVSSEYLF